MQKITDPKKMRKMVTFGFRNESIETLAELATKNNCSKTKQLETMLAEAKKNQETN